MLTTGADTLNPHAALALSLALGADTAYDALPTVRLRTAPPPPIVTPVPAAPRPPEKPQATPQAPTGPHPAEACRDLAELAAAVHAFEGCPLKRTARNTVFTDGNPAAKILLIGEAPGAEEDAQGKPFVGRAGVLLDAVLAAVGLARHHATPERAVLMTESVFWRPPGNRKPNAAEIAVCRPFIRKLIALHAPRRVIACGGTAASELLETSDGIMALRGKMQPLPFAPEIECFPILHPAYLLRVPAAKKPVWHDVLKFSALLSEAD